MARSRVFIPMMALCLGLAAPAAHASEDGAAATRDTNEWRFRVLLDDEEVGYHRFRVADSGIGRRVEIEARFDVRFLFFTAYRYRHSNVEQWSGSCLRAIESTTRAGRQEFRVSGQALRQQFSLETLEDEIQLDSACVRTFAYWDPVILESSRLLNAQSGEWVAVEVRKVGEEVLNLIGRDVTATRYALSLPEGVISLWYGPGGDWLALEAPAPGGRQLRYVPEQLPSRFNHEGGLAGR